MEEQLKLLVEQLTKLNVAINKPNWDWTNFIFLCIAVISAGAAIYPLQKRIKIRIFFEYNETSKTDDVYVYIFNHGKQSVTIVNQGFIIEKKAFCLPNKELEFDNETPKDLGPGDRYSLNLLHYRFIFKEGTHEYLYKTVKDMDSKCIFFVDIISCKRNKRYKSREFFTLNQLIGKKNNNE